ncbi:MAG: hypothetical protein ABIB79_03630 [archaeon]
MDECPYCHREAKDALTSNWFPVYTCLDCDTKFCEGPNCNGPPCPECGSDNYGEYDKVYAD